MATDPPTAGTLGELRSSGYVARTLRQEMQANLQRLMREGGDLFPGILGYEDSVVPAVENSLLCGHDLIFLGERGQGKSRMIRSLVNLLDEWIPIVHGSELGGVLSADPNRFALERARKRERRSKFCVAHRTNGFIRPVGLNGPSLEAGACDFESMDECDRR